MRQNVRIALVVFAYFIISISMVFINKNLLSTKDASIPAPIFITWFQCLCTAFICWLLGRLSIGSPSSSWLSEFPQQEYSISTAQKVFPLSLIFVGMITANNLCLQYVEVSFYNVARSLTIVANVLFTYFFLGQATSFRVLLTLLVVIFGFFIGAEGEVNFSLIGTLFGVTSSIFVSLNSIYTKKVLAYTDDNAWRLSFYNNMNALWLFAPVFFLSGECDTLIRHQDLLYSSSFWLTMLVAGVLGFLIGIVSTMQIKVTSPLTHNISGTAKACVQTVLALFYYQNETTVSFMLGVVLVIFGSLIYTYVRIQEDIQAGPRPTLSTVETTKVCNAERSGTDGSVAINISHGLNFEQQKDNELFKK